MKAKQTKEGYGLKERDEGEMKKTYKIKTAASLESYLELCPKIPMNQH